MSGKFTIKGKLEGVGDVFKRIENLKRSARNKILRPAINSAASVVLKAAKAKVPERSNAPLNIESLKLLKKSLGRKSKTYPSGAVVAIVGARKGFRAQIGVRVRNGVKSKIGDPIYEDPANIAHLVEFGHGGPHPAPPHPFLRPAYDETKGQVTSLIASKVKEGIAKAAK